ncbi:potassium:hydrogen antiporter [Heterobasidion irregulare TC 32-1]|uniref:Potassium:hydrogen antiporter n=1 Tax=Heterobasidion irregulare (strain TC 32-1) TaxID=747525 RepID=W4KEB0_HETIT|nr:potassium:hydrogen antiporter [Heterobasidion irregulare TC 32-1]ETW84079.1 potassium:hydrogen antiporter [Heterobasidion irregulare TC 32-1]
MPKIRTTRTKKPPEGFEDIEGVLDDYAKKMRDAENESHEGKRKTESLWPIMRISHTRSRYIYELYYKREAVSKELYDWLLKEGYADANLIAKWKKTGYEKLCCLRCIQTRALLASAVCLKPKFGRVLLLNACIVGIPEAVMDLFKRNATEQAGVFAGLNPASFNSNDPFPLWVIQTIIGGVILGPTVMGRIPNFTQSIFPKDSLPMLNLTATIGLVFFLFLVGMEVDIRIVRRNARASAAISIAGLVVPLGLGAAVAIPIYREFVDPSVNYGYFILFVAVAIGITAFPVLCRILTEVKLLDTTVGVVVLSAGVGNDVIGWILLALTVALVNASTGLTALWTGSLEAGQPSAMMMTLTLVIVLASAFFTDIIGIHAIFGGFLAGLIIPKENEFDIALVEKLEDLVGLLFLPQYFALSGLRTDFGTLDTGLTWGYTILICVVAFFSKFLSCGLTAKAFGFNPRESGAIGILMSCKGLVELIVLNVGLQAGVLNTRVFSMFVLHALVLTFLTTPLTLWVYPARVRVRVGTVSEKQGPGARTGEDGDGIARTSEGSLKTSFAVVLDRIEQLPAIMTITQLLQRPAPCGAPPPMSDVSHTTTKSSAGDNVNLPVLTSAAAPHSQPTAIHALRLIELSERTSAMLRSQAADSLIQSDPVLSVYRTFGRLNRFSVSTSLSVVPSEEFSANVTEHALENKSQMVIIPWSSSTVAVADESIASSSSSTPYNPFDGLFSKSSGNLRLEHTSSVVYSQFVRRVFANSPVDVGVFIDRGLSLSGSQSHIFLPFFGGPDDRLALSFVIQLCNNDSVTASIVRIKKTDLDADSITSEIAMKSPVTFPGITSSNTLTFPDTVYGQRDTQTRLQSETADNILWSQFTSSGTSHSQDVASALTRITFTEESTSKPLHRTIEMAAQLAQLPRSLFIVAGRSRRMAVDSHQAELRQLIAEKGISVGSEAPKTLGDVAAAYVATGVNASLVVLQACA